MWPGEISWKKRVIQKRQRKHLLQFVLLQWWPWPIIYSEEEIFTVSQSQLDQGNSTFGKTVLSNVQVIDKDKVIHKNDSLSHWGALIKFWPEGKKTLENFSIYWASSRCSTYCVEFRKKFRGRGGERDAWNIDCKLLVPACCDEVIWKSCCCFHWLGENGFDSLWKYSHVIYLWYHQWKKRTSC